MKRRFLQATMFLLLPLALIFQQLAKLYPQSVEQFYSRGFYPAVSSAVSLYFNLFPFSCAECILYALVVFAVFIIVLAFVYLFRRKFKALFKLFVTVIGFAITGYFLFLLMWGLNYNRAPLENNLGYKTGTPTVTELSAILKSETRSINALCDSVSYDKNGRSNYPGGFGKISSGVTEGYAALAKQSSLDKTLFGSGLPRPKSIFASKYMSYTGIEGIFVPFTYEPNVNTDCPAFVLPFNAAHESAHYKGFAREQEASFVAYLADTANSDPYFQYSAHMEAYIYISNALYETDQSAWQKAAGSLDPRAKGDFQYYNDFIVSHSSYAADVSSKVNDSYLKSQGQQGIITYDMFVTLLADKYRSEPF
jgi:hypothetical protein